MSYPARELYGLEIRHLATLRAIVQAGSFRGAARRLGYTQSAVSQQIAALEAAVGTRVLERPRGRGTISVTEAGLLVLAHAEVILARIVSLQSDLVAYRGGKGGRLAIGAYQSVGAHVLPKVLGRFGELYPSVTVSLLEATQDRELLSSLHRAELDLAFVDLPLDTNGLDAVELYRDPYVAIVPVNSQLATRKAAPTLDEIATFPLIGARECRTWVMVEEELRRRAIEPAIVFRSDENGTVHGLVASGMGIALRPQLAAQGGTATTVRGLGGDVPERVIGVAWRRAGGGLAKKAADFVSIARQVFLELQRSQSLSAHDADRPSGAGRPARRDRVVARN
jgi:DNA-binding transcriptional LysR family regulator